MTSELHLVLDRWGLEPAGTIERTESGTMNDTYVVTTARRRVVLRRHRRTDRRQIEWEHEVVAHVRAGGVPVPAAISTPDGEFVVGHGGRWFSLFTYADGEQVERTCLRPGHARAMGTTLAHIHHALADVPHPPPAKNQPAPTPEESLRRMEDLVALIERRDREHTFDQCDAWMVDRLRSRMTWLASEGAQLTLPEAPAGAARLTHGDYQETNVFFAGAGAGASSEVRVAAVIDWDKAEVRWPAEEILRALDYSLLLAPELCSAFVDGYRSVSPLAIDDLDLAADIRTFDAAHSTWLPEEIYLHGNDRVRQFVRPGPFVPFNRRWHELRRVLATS
ncbi:phosphotransferase enzyme family protein [Actinopolymorpha singaporensis]|uniref:Ser/Thr protein kinase RdoA involved in Cpx stress response, MazF antagonist n=1 Tax=Actinopolymorpha singaporensis TaxID=117157 RepID=A0A1H1PHX9_9ACTN|nr:phosphotransferase [Actinopolymorpha singaporensis]SDS10744.1 Ser/Thr protein kinase RdoA involved in Cpx stress response, MazF antagonist [Actinopolymorpha singaporensis]